MRYCKCLRITSESVSGKYVSYIFRVNMILNFSADVTKSVFINF